MTTIEPFGYRLRTAPSPFLAPVARIPANGSITELFWLIQADRLALPWTA